MKLYHGTTWDRAEALIEAGEYQPGHSDNPWSGGEMDGLFCSNVFEYAEQYGDIVIEIDVEDDAVDVVQACPIGPGDYGWRPEYENAIEFLVPAGVKFSARIA
jgi:hypothetical protein